MIAALIGRLRGVHANHKRIASGAALIGLLVIGAKLFVAAREMAIAWRYGISGTVDAYQLALTVTTWLPTMLAAVATVVLVPRLVALQREGTGGYRGFIEELNGGVLLLGLGLALATWAAAPFAADILSGTLDRETAELTRAMSLRMAPVAFFAILIGYFSARLQARERFAYSAAEAVPAVVITLFVIGAPDSAAAWPLVWGTLFGWLLQLAWLGRMVHANDPPLGRVRFRHRSEQWQTLYGSLIAMGLGQAFITAVLPVDQLFAAHLGEGAVATLGYVNRIITLATGFGTVVFARALLPVLSGAVAEGNLALGRRQTLTWSWIMGGLAIAGAAVGWLLAPLLVQILFQRGAFGAEETARVAEVLRWGMLQFPPLFAGIVLVQWYAATGRYRAILLVTFVAFLAKVGANFAFAGPFGVSGLMIGTAVMYSVTALMMAMGAGRLGPISRKNEPL